MLPQSAIRLASALATALMVLAGLLLASSPSQALDVSVKAGPLDAALAAPAGEGLDLRLPAAEVADLADLSGLPTRLLPGADLEVHGRALPLWATAGEDEAEAASTAAPQPLVRALAEDPAAGLAAGAVAAFGALALKAEPVRRGLFLLALPLYSRLRRSELLENGVRERIYRAVEGHPGLSIIQVCRGAKVGWGTAVYHLQRLERDRLIVSRRDGQYRRFFLNGQAPDPSAPEGPRALRHPLARRIGEFLVGHPGAVQKEVCAALGISAPLASKWLGRLLEDGLLTSRREWKHVRYEPTARLHEALAALPAPPGVRAGAEPTALAA